MTSITINGEEQSWEPGRSVASIVLERAPNTRGIAVAVDRCVIPRSEWESTVLEPGAEVEIVTAAAGG